MKPSMQRELTNHTNSVMLRGYVENKPHRRSLIETSASPGPDHFLDEENLLAFGHLSVDVTHWGINE